MTESQSREDSADSFWNTLRVIFLERLSSPLISTFIISWCVTNYKVILIILGKAPLNEKMTRLDGYFHGPFYTLTWPADWFWIVGVPALATYFYIYWYPKINMFVMKTVDENNNALQNQKDLMKYKSKIEVLVSEKDSMQTVIAEQKLGLVEVENSLKNKNIELDALTAEIKNLQETLADNSRTTEDERKVLEAVYLNRHETNSMFLEEALDSSIGLLREVDYLVALFGLVNKGYLEITTEKEIQMMVITVKGIEEIAKMGSAVSGKKPRKISQK